MLFLRQVRLQPNGGAARRETRAADRELADFLSRGDITFEQRRRQIADGDVVESVAGRIARQQRCCVEVQREQVANGVLIFSAIQPAERIGPAGIRRGDGDLSSAVSSESSAAVRTLRRDDARPGEASDAREASGRLFPRRPSDRREPVCDGIELEATGSHLVVVTRQAVRRDQGLVGSLGRGRS